MQIKLRYGGLGRILSQMGKAMGVALISVGCQSSPAKPVENADTATVHPTIWPRAKWPLATDRALEKQVRELLASMTVEEKVGQIIQGDISSVTPDDIRQYHLGSILAGGNSGPDYKQYATPEEWLKLADEYYSASVETKNGRKGIPIIFGIDAVHGHNNVIGATLYPHNIGLGATRNPKLVGKIAAATAIELRVTGADWTFAPTLTVPQDDRWGRIYEGFSENPAVVASYARQIVEGLQGVAGTPNFLDGSHVLASAKHFVGDGGTAEGKDQGDAQISETTLRDIHSAGYIPAISAGVQSVMASFSSWNGEKMHGNKALLVDVLRKQMGFDGFVIGDWNAHGQLDGCSNDSCAAAFNAGVDMLMAPDSWQGYYYNALDQVRSGEIPMARLDEAVARVLRAKFRLGLFTAGPPSKRPLGGKFKLIGNPEHRALARQAVRESLVLLKNNQHILPLNPKLKILVAGDGADDIAKQSGGWTLTWQGTGTFPEDFPGAQSIWSGIQTTVSAAGGKASFAANGKYNEKPDVAIVVFGEEPYAEFKGDLETLEYKPGDTTDLDLLRRLKADGILVVAVFLSGRPLWMNREINAADAFVAAWLPGSEGGGIADVLFKKANGAVNYDFKGKLSYSWPRTAMQTPLNFGQKNYDPLFPFDFGLTYKDKVTLPTLDESASAAAESLVGVYLARGKVAEGWTMQLVDSHAQSTAVTVLPATSVDGSIRVTAVDHLAQEDGRRIKCAGNGTAIFELNTDKAVDLSRETDSDTMLVLTLKPDNIPEGPISLGVGCGANCGAQLSLRDSLAALPGGTWQRLGVPLKCFRAAGADMSKVTTIARIETATALDLSLSKVATDTQADHVVDCAQ